MRKLLDVGPGGKDLTETEAKVWRAVQSGEVVDLRSGDPEVDRPERGQEWDAGRTVRAEVLACLLVGGADVPLPAPKGVRLRGARISGQLDLEAATLRCPLALLDCSIAHTGKEQPEFQPLIYTLDVILPVVNLHQRDAWILHGPVQWLALVFTVTGWILTTAVVLSLTGILKRE